MYRRNVKLSFRSFVSALLAILMLAVSVSTQTTAPTFPGQPNRQRPVNDVIFWEELLRQPDDRPKIAGHSPGSMA